MKTTKEQLQKMAVETARDNPFLILEWATGTGKTKASLLIIEELAREKKADGIDIPLKVLILIAESAHRQNWKEEMDKWLSGTLLMDIKMECYQSIHKCKGEYDLLIMDEMHHIGSEKRMDCLWDIDAYRVLGLTATLKDSIFNSIKYRFPRIIKSVVTLEDAIKWNLVPFPEIILTPLALGREPVNTVYLPSGKGKEKKQVRCSEQQIYERLDRQVEMLKRMYIHGGQEYQRIRWMKAGSERKRFLGSIKTDAVRELIKRENLDNRRYICFCSSIEQATALGHGNDIHSKKNNSQDSINRFNNRESNCLYSVGMAQEGLNLTDIEVCIIVQLDGEIRGFLQKVGRSLRGKDPKVYILYVENTKDEEYLRKALDEIKIPAKTLMI